LISDCGFSISDFKSAITNRAEGELGEANPKSDIKFKMFFSSFVTNGSFTEGGAV